jgi:phage terminase small subunit
MAKRGKDGDLTEKQRLFCDEYLKDLNASQAAIRAGYSPRSAGYMGSTLLSNPKVESFLVKAREARDARIHFSQDDVLNELRPMAFSNVDDYVLDGEGKLAPAPGRPDTVMRAVSSVKYRTHTYNPGKPDEWKTTEVEFRLWDKPGTLKLAGRHVGLFPDRVEHTGKDGVPLTFSMVIGTGQGDNGEDD